MISSRPLQSRSNPSLMISIPSSKVIFFKLLHPVKMPLAFTRLLGISTCVKEVQFWKALFPICATLFDSINCPRLVQSAKALIPIPVTLSEITIPVSPAQPANAWSPIVVTLAGISTAVSAEQRSKADTPMAVTVSGMVTDFSCAQPLKRLSITFIVPSSKVTVSRPLPPNAPPFTSFRTLGISITFSALQFPNPLPPMYNRLFGRFTDDRLVQL